METLPEHGSPGESSAVTIYDVAAAAGVAISTVSRVVNGSGNPRPETKERVLKAIHDLGFVPNGAARGLSRRTKGIVGLVFVRTDLDGPVDPPSMVFADFVIRGAERAAEARGYSLLVRGVAVGEAAEPIKVLTGQTDGLLLLERVVPEERMAEVARGFPVVMVSGSGAVGPGVTVGCDNKSGIADVVGHMVQHHGLKRLTFVTGSPDSPDSNQRVEAFLASASAHGVALEEGSIWQCDWSLQRVREVVHAQLDTGRQLPEAIVCANDDTAIIVMHALLRRDLRVPEDVAVVGFDDIPIARYMHPPLATVNQPVEQLGSTAFEMLVSMLQGGPQTGKILLPTTFVPRHSCGCP